jgi:hypothetical protein
LVMEAARVLLKSAKYWTTLWIKDCSMKLSDSKSLLSRLKYLLLKSQKRLLLMNNTHLYSELFSQSSKLTSEIDFYTFCTL